MIERKGRKVADVPHPWLDAVLGVGMPGVLSMADPGYVCTAAEPLPIPSWDDLAAERATDRDRARRDRARLVATGVCSSGTEATGLAAAIREAVQHGREPGHTW